MTRLFSLTLILTAILFTGLPPANAAGDDAKSFFDRHGLTLLHGRSAWTSVGPAAEVPYEWTTAAYVLTKELSSWFSLDTQIGGGYLKADHRGDSPSAELRLLGDIHYKWLFVQLGCGVAHVFDPDALPGLAESKTHSIVSGAAGLRFPIGRSGPGPVELTLAYGVEHLSAISKHGSDGDTGWNAGGPRIGVTWHF